MSYKRERMEDAPPEILEEHKLTCNDGEYTVLKVKMTPEQAKALREILEIEGVAKQLQDVRPTVSYDEAEFQFKKATP